MLNLPIARPEAAVPLAQLEVTVKNHPGVMSHVCGLFSRRACNVEGILCMPLEESGGSESRIWLLVRDEPRLEQMIKQVEKLNDVRKVERTKAGPEVFARLEAFFAGRGASA